jgi:hypothetical protein
MMQGDVLSGHLNSSGFAMLGRTRLKGVYITASSTAGTVNLWDTAAAPVTTGTYGRSGTTVTVSSTGHGLVTGQKIGITFATATGVSATNGNYTVAVSDANTFTVTDINSGTIATSTGCTYVTSGRWLTSLDTAALTTSGVPQNGVVFIPGEGMLVAVGIYAQLSNQAGITVFYG